MPRHRLVPLSRLVALPVVALAGLVALYLPATLGARAVATATQPAIEVAAPSASLSIPRGPYGATVPGDEAPSSTAPSPRPTPPPVSSLTGYVWPLAHGRVTLPFGPTAWGTLVVGGVLFHDGVDMATFCGDRVVAAHGGIVLAAGHHYDQEIGWVGDLAPYIARLDQYGAWGTLANVVVIDDGDGYRAIYAHFASVAVKVGQQVATGQFIGYEGRSGDATGCHVHFGLFSPLETATFGLRPDIVKRVKLPALEIARIDPLQVLPWPAPLGLGPGDRHPAPPTTPLGAMDGRSAF